MGWVSLFSGGKDSAYAYFQAIQANLDVEWLLTVHAGDDSYMYHVPATRLTKLAAESIGLPLIDVEVEQLGVDYEADAAEHGDAETDLLATELQTLQETRDVRGLVAGAVESEFQASRLQGLCDSLDIACYTPLWQVAPDTISTGMLDAGFQIVVVQVAAAGLDASWLGRTLDAQAFQELSDLRESHGVHPLGEGGEFETLVTDGPHMSQSIELEYDTVWEGDRGHIEVLDAWLD